MKSFINNKRLLIKKSKNQFLGNEQKKNIQNDSCHLSQFL